MNYSAPDTATIKHERSQYGLTQAQAAALIHVSTVTWQQWEQDKRKMHPAFWELFTIKVAQLDKSE